ncbi:hypothetical protein GF402_09135 [Candidatus Fermentibacteria bacterium]|nr:hypothetical protein [Candidatus Fermentibacteria bacterium]
MGSDPDWKPLLERCYQRYLTAVDSIPDAYSLENVFDDLDRQVYTDMTGVHLTPEGNRVLAGRIGDLISPGERGAAR